MDKLLKYLNSLSKESRAIFAKACGTTEGYLRKAVSSGQVLHTTTCVAIERESGGAVSRKDLHPDDWAAHWPELTASAPNPQRATMTTRKPAKEVA